MIAVNGVDLASFGFVAQTRRLSRLPGQASAVIEVPGVIGGIVAGGSVGPGRLTVEGAVVAPDRSTLLARLDELAAAVRGECVLWLTDLPDREWHGVLQRIDAPVSEFAPQWTSRVARVTLDWLLPDPTAVARVETILAGPTALLALGTAPSSIAVDVVASAGGPITRIVVAVQAGATVLRWLQWDGTLAPPAVWRLDDESYSVTVDGANAIDGLTPDSEFPDADPAEGADRVVVTVTGGEAQIIVRYRRRWW